MTSQLTKSSISFEEYLLLPYDGRKTEFVDGQIIAMTEPSTLHIVIIGWLADQLKFHIKEEALELDVCSGPGVQIPRVGRRDNCRDPDLIVCDRAQWRGMRHLTKSIFLKGNPPALVIEVVSPGTVKTDTVYKRAEYADARVPEYWIVNPVDGYVSIWVLNGRIYECTGEYRADERIQSALLPKLELSAGAILDPWEA
ncbi:MAG: Uma2 family endonuclease [Leptolyngbya sp. SIO4C1]|nr:Uma2 family endonuclease [Leptolyngbya sp. SIO4C1]